MFGERLRLQLDEIGLSPSQFADSIGVNRSAVSHLLNNRNNPGYDFLNKVYEHYPEWDMDWLLFNQPKKTARKEPETPRPQKTYKSAENKRPEPQEVREQRSPSYEQGDLFNEYEPLEAPKRENTTSIKKTVTKTILIYSDGTFEIYQNNFR